MSAKTNPFFAKALVNRYWKHFFKRGLIEPEDDMRDTNPPTNPELLDALAKHFIESGYDLKALVRAITQIHTYQLSAMPNEHNAVDRQNFSRYYPKRLHGRGAARRDRHGHRHADRLRRSAARHARRRAARQQLQPLVAFPERLRPARRRERLRVRARAVLEPRAEPAPDERAGHEGEARRAAAAAPSSSRKAERPSRERIRELYLAAFSREPTRGGTAASPKRTSRKPRTDADGKPLDSAARQAQGLRGPALGAA